MAYFKQKARDALFGNWRVAILTGFVSSLLGGNLTYSGGNYSSSSNYLNDSFSGLAGEEFLEIIIPLLSMLASFFLVYGIIAFIIGGATKLGYAKFNLNLIDGKSAAFSDLFSQYNRLGTGICMDLLTGLYIALWSLLFVIPGIIRSYSYAMTPYILAENPGMTANEAITASRRIMDGNKWRLFCLHFSFIGWELLCILPPFVLLPLVAIGPAGVALWAIVALAGLIAGSLFLAPYREAAQAAFYRGISYVPQYEVVNEY